MGGIYSSLDQFSGITTLPVAVDQGGTGQTSLDSNKILFGNGTSPILQIPASNPSYYNIGFSYSGSTFTVHSGDGTAFSATNPGIIVLSDRSNFNQSVVYRVTANQDFIDATGASEIIGNLFGFTTGVAIPATVPFFLYACPNDAQDTITFGISRIPHLKNAPAVANLGSPSSATANIEASIFLLEDVTLGDYDGNPVFSMGSFRMTMNSSDDWTVQALDTEDGIGNFNENRVFTGYTGQFGANAGTYTINNGGTAPTFTAIGQQYNVTRDGYCYVNTSLRNDGGGDGSGAVAAQVAIPFEVDNLLPSLGGQLKDTALIYRNNGSNEISPLYFLANSHVVQFFRLGTTISDLYEWQDFGNGNRTIAFSSIYKIDNVG